MSEVVSKKRDNHQGIPFIGPIMRKFRVRECLASLMEDLMNKRRRERAVIHFCADQSYRVDPLPSSSLALLPRDETKQLKRKINTLVESPCHGDDGTLSSKEEFSIINSLVIAPVMTPMRCSEKSILFFEAQRSGKLPPNQRISWRGNSGLSDGSLAKDLTGGYYDAGDNVKFNFPMAYTTTMLSWNTLIWQENGTPLQNARAMIRWATDYFLKCANAAPNKLFVGVGDPNVDHKCWERPEDMDTIRAAYYVSPKSWL
ncbi:hypothetical protein HAX54_027957 [Datura stramonium]|uniref:cellulase n=1 Tax=Datura stramonium TaxID=4076 RepID=A0ABS8V3P6_DATST|nr:hypothetical protein [Datura stramonium]